MENYSNTFIEKVALGTSSEEELMSRLVKQGFLYVEKNPSQDVRGMKGWDIKFYSPLNKFWYYVEVKTDLKASTTGNVAIEYKYKNKNSGILSTQSNVWIQVIDGDFYWAWTENLLHYVLTNQWDYNKVRKSGGGDNEFCSIFLIKMKNFLTIASKWEV